VKETCFGEEVKGNASYTLCIIYALRNLHEAKGSIEYKSEESTLEILPPCNIRDTVKAKRSLPETTTTRCPKRVVQLLARRNMGHLDGVP